jgi:cold shock CspA family protein
VTQTEFTAALDLKQDTLTAGTNVSIEIITDESGITTNTILAIGDVTQTDLTSALDLKQDTLTAGTNVSNEIITDESGITTNTISAIQVKLVLMTKT